MGNSLLNATKAVDIFIYLFHLTIILNCLDVVDT